MPLPTLKLQPWTGGPPPAAALPAEGAVLWLERLSDGGAVRRGGPGAREIPADGRRADGLAWLDPLAAGLGSDRLWSPPLSVVPVPGPEPRNAFTFDPDAHPPLRWGRVQADVRDLADLPDRPRPVVAVVFEGVFEGLGQQAARTLLAQARAVLPEDAPWLLVERNGRALGEVVRHLRRPDADRGEAAGTVRSPEELRRLLEVAGFGITGAHGLGGGRLRGRTL